MEELRVHAQKLMEEASEILDADEKRDTTRRTAAPLTKRPDDAKLPDYYPADKVEEWDQALQRLFDIAASVKQYGCERVMQQGSQTVHKGSNYAPQHIDEAIGDVQKLLDGMAK